MDSYQGRPDTIGEFGLGMLTMHHFTNVRCDLFFLDTFLSYCYSWPCGSRVLFLDPSKGHLPLPDCASVILLLQRVQQSVDGLFGFNLSLPRVSHARSFHSDSKNTSRRIGDVVMDIEIDWLAHWKAVATPCTWDQIPSEFHREASAQAIVRGSRGETGLYQTATSFPLSLFLRRQPCLCTIQIDH